MASTKKIEIFLPDGSPTSFFVCTMVNWDGKVLRIPKNLFSDYSAREEMRYTGLYFLVGEGDDDSRPRVYIGESENLRTRLAQHMNEDFWNECIAIIKKEDSLDKTHVKYLENHCYKLAKKVSRCELINKCTPAKAEPSEADKAVLNDFAKDIETVISTLGYQFLTRPTDTSKQKSAQFMIISKRDPSRINARGRIVDEGFLVEAGSICADHFKPASKKSLRIKWDKLHEQGIIKGNKFVKEYLASAPSTAAAMVLGRNADGLIDWKTKDGKTLKAYLEEIKDIDKDESS